MGRITDLYVLNQKYTRPNIDTSHRCLLQCPLCIRQRLSSQDQIRRSFDMTEDTFLKICNYYDNSLVFCGQISDPIYHPKFLDFLKICNEQNRLIRIATNGSHRSDSWWEKAFSYGVGNNAWCFGVDGIDEKSELYRVGSNFKDVWKRMQQGRDLGHAIIWQYIIFDYNQNDIDRAIEIAEEEDFSLLLVHTNRYFSFNTGMHRSITKEIKPPDSKYLTEQGPKKEYYPYRSQVFRKWAEKNNIPRELKK